MFNNVVYKETFGTPMGSPLSLIIADLVMQDLEVHIFNSLNSSLPIYLSLDDILLATHENDIKYIFDKFNNYHNRLKFTIEYENNHCLSFLDQLKQKKRKLSLIDFTRIPFRAVTYLSSRITRCVIK